MKYIKNTLMCVIIFFSFTCIYDAKKEVVTLSKCVDGDTARFIYNDNEIKARFLAIDTPETVHPTKEVMAYGKNANEYTCNMLTNAKTIEIEYDPESDKKDKYDRDLVWVFVDGELLQNKLVSVGYASVKYIYGDYYYTDLLLSSEEKAKENKLGIWNDENENSNQDNKAIKNKSDDNTDSKKEEKTSSTFVINGYTFEISNKYMISALVILGIILTLTKSKIKIKKKK